MRLTHDVDQTKLLDDVLEIVFGLNKWAEIDVTHFEKLLPHSPTDLALV